MEQPESAVVRPAPATSLGPSSCASCPVGVAAGVRRGQRCPLIDRRYPARARVFAQGEPGHTVWFIKRGALVLARAHRGRDYASGIRRAGEFVGEEALVHGNYGTSARTTEASVLCGIPRGRFDAWLGPADAPARMLLEHTLRSAADAARLACGAPGTARQRLARWLLDAGDASAVERGHLAAMLGMTPETLSRTLTSLATSGVIAVTRRAIEVRAWADLAAIAADAPVRSVRLGRDPRSPT